jgi:hypothetical protein
MQYRQPWQSLAGVGALAALLTLSSRIEAGNRYAVEPEHVEETRAFRYALFDNEDCFAELDRRGFPYKRVEPTPQVDGPLRFSGPIHGVTFSLTYRGPDVDEDAQSSSIADCRLALAIDDLGRVLEKHDIVKAEYMSMYRRRGVGFVKPGKRHPSGRAIDVATVTRKDGKTFSVLYDWHGLVGSKTCGEGARAPTKDTEGARLLRAIVCDVADEQAFNLILTPHYDWGHKDHFHMEVRSDIRWFLVQ